MTSSPVKGVNSLMNYTSAKGTGKSGEDLAGNFTDVFSKASGQQQSMILQNDNAVQGSSKVSVNSADKKGLENKAVSKPNDKGSKTQNIRTDKQTKDEIQKAGEELAGKVAEELGVSVEEVENAMEMLGLTMADLLNQDNLTQLVLTITGGDMLSLVTDEGLYASLQNLLGAQKDIWNQLQETLAVSPEELADIMNQIKAGEQSADGEHLQDITQEGQQEIPDGQKDYTVTVEKNGEVTEVSVKVDGEKETAGAEVTTQEAQISGEKKVKASAGKEDGGKKDTSSHGDNTQNNLLLENLLNRNNTVKEAAFSNTAAANTADTQEIMNQIMDYMKIQVKADLTQMEIQLHPASLGTVNINISSKEGVITAQFLTQNEAVKAAIESQIVQLKSSFEEQGLKVEAVEVTVESHQFERNLSGESNARQQSQDEKKKGGRKINLNELSLEEEPEMDEAEQLAVEMMSAGGNTVDYTA